MDKELEQGIESSYKKENTHRYCQFLKDRFMNLNIKKMSLYYLSIFLLNVLSIICVWVYQANHGGLVPFDNVFKSIDWKFVWLILLIIAISILIKVTSDYITIRVRTKQRRFGTILLANLYGDFYNCVTIGQNTSSICLFSHLWKSGVNNIISLECAYAKRFFNKVGSLILGFATIVIGSLLMIGKIKLWIIILASAILFVSIIPIIIILFFDKKKDKFLSLVASVSRFLFKMRLIKDYEQFYKNSVDKLHFYSNSLKINKLSRVLNIVSNIAIGFLRCFTLYLILLLLNFDVSGVFGEVIYNFVILEIIISIIPLPCGTFIYEWLFSLLFGSIFFDGYIMWGVLIFRLFDYFIYYLIFGVVKIGECFYKKIKNRKNEVVSN